MRWLKTFFVIPVLAWVAFVSTSARAEYNIGIGKSDITGPAAEVLMMGFSNLKESTAGILNRLYARAYLIEDPDTSERVMFVHCDIHSVMQLVHQEVLAELATKYNGVYTEQNVILHATHTHAGPGGTAGYFLYDVSILGYINENFDKIVSGIMDAIDKAHNSVASGTIRWNKGEVSKGGNNRSPDAYLANPASERAKYSSNIDTTMRALHFFSSAGKLRGVLAFYPVHANSLTGDNLLISGDNKGYAEFLVEDELDDVVVGIGIANAGDVSPNLVENSDGTFSGEGNTTIESAEIMGKREYDTLSTLINSTSELVEGSAVAKLSYVDMSNVTLDGVETTEDDPYANRTCPGIVGQNFAAGTEDGRGLGWFSEGDLKANPFFEALGAALTTKTPQWVQDCQHSVKVPLLATGLAKPIPWTPNILPVQIVKIGQFAIAVTSFEVTTMAGRRIRSTVKEALADAGVTEVELAAISNAYVQYMTTKEEYFVQDYEGASTLFGPNQLAAVQQELSRVAASIVDTSVELDVGPTPLQIDRASLVTFQTGVVVDTAPSGGFSAVRTQPESSYAVGGVASCVFAGAHPKNALTLVTSFCDVEKLDSDGRSYSTVMTDAHWDLRYRWKRYGIAGSKNTCEWNIRSGGRTSVAGTYRFIHRGYSRSLTGKLTAYEGTSNTFTLTS
ncbi:Neutral ceramidase [Phytophthora cinnamomi]|uniref:Neutral ceramidase n=1 Tax=Phytophthora cinnamomi TaxID=4785 RepID=UPI00355A98F1|nr:Neutral ceramidase [Phytophthora cinnamomi]